MVMQENKTSRNWRQQTGAGAHTPPGGFEVSTSEGDKKRNSLGPARFPRTFVRYVANDDGTPITDETNRLLARILESQETTNELLRKLLIEVEEG